MLVEISKDMIDGQVSIKEVGRCLELYREEHPDARISFAGTTDLTGCSGFGFRRYLDYLAIQAAQARFLGAGFFRFFVGQDAAVPGERVAERLARFADLLDPIVPVLELHLGWESSLGHLDLLVDRTRCGFVVDFENCVAADLDPHDLLARLPEARVVYAHTRNLSPSYVEHQSSVDWEDAWRRARPATDVLWEPKRLSCAQTLERLDVD
jgi:hypothetical protein